MPTLGEVGRPRPSSSAAGATGINLDRSDAMTTNVYITEVDWNGFYVSTNETEQQLVDGDELLDFLDTLEGDAPTITVGDTVFAYGSARHESFAQRWQEQADGGHPYAPEDDSPNARCGDCNRRGDVREHAGHPVDYHYWPEEARPPETGSPE
jgi:hypothetical protein